MQWQIVKLVPDPHGQAEHQRELPIQSLFCVRPDAWLATKLREPDYTNIVRQEILLQLQ